MTQHNPAKRRYRSGLLLRDILYVPTVAFFAAACVLLEECFMFLNKFAGLLVLQATLHEHIIYHFIIL